MALDEALKTPKGLGPRQCRTAEIRYLGGLTVEETAEALHIPPAKVRRERSLAKVWLLNELSKDGYTT